MRVLLWPTNYYRQIGGIERLTHSLALALIKRHHDVLVITDNPRSDQSEHDEIDGVTIRRLPFTHALTHKNLPLVKATIMEMTATTKDFKPSIANLHGWQEAMCFYQTRVLQKTATPHCLTIHGLLEQLHYRIPLCLKIWQSSNAVSAVSQALLEPLWQQGYRDAKLRVIHNGIARDFTDTPPRAIASTNRLLCIGRLTEEKGFDVMLHAFARLPAKYSDIRLTIIGDGPIRQELEQMAFKLGITNSVTFLGARSPDQINTFIDNSTFVIVPSTYESFGLVALEAAMRARALVASDVQGLREVVANGETGLLVPPNNPIALANAIESLLSDPATLHTMGQRARSRAETLFNLDLMTERYLAMYEDCLT